MVPPKDCFDVVILGGGPAGCAAGLTLLKRDGVSVAIVEASDYTVPRIGESLTPGIRPLLEYLDLWCDF
ncbi:MAG: tryptophan 7-halogenase, partial [Planctomycetota bacterium]